MIDLPYSLVIEATNEQKCFGFYSAELKGGPKSEMQLRPSKWASGMV
jgi:hypothetical protein